MRVMLVEDDAGFRSGIERVLSRSTSLTLAASFADPRKAIRQFKRAARLGDPVPCDLLLLDLDLPNVHGLVTMQAIKAVYPELMCVVLTGFEEPTTILQAILAGADGYLLKTTPPDELLDRLGELARGGAPMSPPVARSVLKLLRSEATERPDAVAPSRLDLTEREHQVLQCLVAGSSYREVGDELGVSLDTVRTHVRRVYRKLGVNSMAQAVAKAIREGVV